MIIRKRSRSIPDEVILELAGLATSDYPTYRLITIQAEEVERVLRGEKKKYDPDFVEEEFNRRNPPRKPLFVYPPEGVKLVAPEFILHDMLETLKTEQEKDEEK